jgi:hypothetical protein
MHIQSHKFYTILTGEMSLSVLYRPRELWQDLRGVYNLQVREKGPAYILEMTGQVKTLNIAPYFFRGVIQVDSDYANKIFNRNMCFFTSQIIKIF